MNKIKMLVTIPIEVGVKRGKTVTDKTIKDIVKSHLQYLPSGVYTSDYKMTWDTSKHDIKKLI